MQRHDQRAQLALLQILQLVDQKAHDRPAGLGCVGHGKQQIGQIALQIPAVRHAQLRIDAQLDLCQVACLYLRPEAPNKAPQHAQTGLRCLAQALLCVQTQQQPPQRRNQKRGQRLVLVRLDQQRMILLLLRHLPDSIEKHRLSHAAQSNQDLTARRQPGTEPIQNDIRIFQNLLPARQLGGEVPAPGAKGFFLASIVRV
jgi:hypothetical protein